MKVNKILLTKNATDLPFLQIQKSKKEININHDEKHLRYLFYCNDLLDLTEKQSDLDLTDPYNIFGVVRAASELGLLNDILLNQLYVLREHLTTNIIVSMWTYIHKTDVYKVLLEQIKILPEIEDLPIEFMLLLMEVNPVLVFQNYKTINRTVLIELCRKTFFDVNVSRKYYRIIRNHIATIEFRIYLDEDDEILTYIHENKVKLFIYASANFEYKQGRYFAFRPNTPLYIGQHLWRSNYQETYVIESIKENDVSVIDTLSDSYLSFDHIPPAEKLLVPLTREYYWR